MHPTTDRSILDPLMWIEQGVAPVQPEVAPEPPQQDREWIDEAIVDHAITYWRMSKKFPGRGNDMFFRLATELRRAGMAIGDIEAKLRRNMEGHRLHLISYLTTCSKPPLQGLEVSLGARCAETISLGRCQDFPDGGAHVDFLKLAF
jgi:hypothetical protein